MSGHVCSRAWRTALASLPIAVFCAIQPASASDNSCSVAANGWIGGVSTNWLDKSGWFCGGLIPGLPDPSLPVYFGPARVILSGVPTDRFDVPLSEAVLGGVYSSTRTLTVRAWDGISQIRLTPGGLLSMPGTVGGVNPDYVPQFALQPATLVLDGGSIAGAWTFEEHSRVLVNAAYALPQGTWSGRLDELAISSSGSLVMQSSVAYRSISNAGQLTIANGATATVQGSLYNAGTLTLSSTTSSATLFLAGDTTLSGSGQTVMSGGNARFIGNNSGAAELLTIGTGHTLRGTGSLGTGMNVANRGTVLAEGSNGLSVSVTTFDNTDGTVQIADGSVFSMGGQFTSGTLHGLGSGSRIVGGTFADVALTGTLSVANGTSISARGTIDNRGTLTLSSSTSSATLFLLGDTTLSGSGQTVMSGGNARFIGNNSGAAELLTIGTGHTLRGTGSFGTGMNVANRGTVLAEGSNGMSVSVTTFDNTRGTVQIADGSVFSMSGQLTGGTLHGPGAGSRIVGGTFADVALTGTLSVANGTSISARGTIDNRGTLTLSSSTTSATLFLLGDTTLSGSGQTVMTGSFARILGNNSGVAELLTIVAGHTLRGSGSFGSGMDVVNRGLIVADGSAGLQVSVTTFDNATGAVQVGGGSLFQLVSGVLSGGTLAGIGPGARIGGSGTFSDVRLTGALDTFASPTFADMVLVGSVSVPNGTSLNTRGIIDNEGSLTLSSTTSSATLFLASDTTLSGSGQTVMAGGNARILGNNSGAAELLTIGTGHTLRGTGSFGSGMNIANRGAVLAEGNNGLSVSVTTFDNTGGTVQVADGSVFSMGGQFTGGTLHGLGSGSRIVGSTFADVALTGSLSVANGTSIFARGTIDNRGTLTLSSSTSSATLFLIGDTTLSGAGQTVMTGSFARILGNNSGVAELLTIGAGHTLRGTGSFGSGIAVTNYGTVRADASGSLTFTLANGTFVNRGGVVVDPTGNFNALSQVLLQDRSEAKTVVNGVMRVQRLDLAAGTLSGSGRIVGAVNVAGGSIAPGNSPGLLTVDGDLSLGIAGSAVFEINGKERGVSYDAIDVTGDAILGGTLMLAFGYAAQVGDSFSLIQPLGAFVGSFDAVLADGYGVQVQLDAAGLHLVVTEVLAVPESTSQHQIAAGLMLLFGLLQLGRQRRSKRAGASCGQ